MAIDSLAAMPSRIEAAPSMCEAARWNGSAGGLGESSEQGLQVGADAGGRAGEYEADNHFGGRIWELKLIYGEWSEAVIKKEAQPDK